MGAIWLKDLMFLKYNIRFIRPRHRPFSDLGLVSHDLVLPAKNGGLITKDHHRERSCYEWRIKEERWSGVGKVLGFRLWRTVAHGRAEP